MLFRSKATNDAQGEGTTSTQVEPSTSTTSQENAQEQEHDLHQRGQTDNQEPSGLGGEQEPSTPRTPLQSTQEQEEGNDEDICVGETFDQAMNRRVIRRASRLDVQQHFKENILGSIRRGVSTRNQLSNFCGHVSCLSSLEPLKVYEALEDLDWVAAKYQDLAIFD